MNAPAPQQAAPQPGAAPRRRRFTKEKAQEALKTLKVDKIPVPAIRPSVAVHAGIAAIYVVLAILATAAIWSFGASVAGESGLGRGLGLLVGILVLLAGGLMHDNYVRRRKQETMVHEITNLKDAYGEVMGELEGIKQAIIRPGGQPIFGVETARGPDAGEVGQEIQALQTLLEKIAKDRSAESWEAAHARAQSAGQDLTPEQRAARRALLGGLDENKVLAAVDDALKHDRLDLYLKPVVRLPSRKRMGFECSCRIRLPNGASLTADQYGLVAADAGLLGYVQNLLLVRTVQLVRQTLRSNADYVFFCPIAPQTLAERSFLVEFVKQMEATAGLAQRMVFGLSQPVLPTLPDIVNKALFRLASCGFRFYLDDVQTLALDVEDLSERKVRFVKFPSPLLLVGQQQAPARDPRNLKRVLDRFGIDGMIAGIDDEGTLLELLDFALDFGQGELFGQARPALADPHGEGGFDEAALNAQPNAQSNAPLTAQ